QTTKEVFASRERPGIPYAWLHATSGVAHERHHHTWSRTWNGFRLCRITHGCLPTARASPRSDACGSRYSGPECAPPRHPEVWAVPPFELRSHPGPCGCDIEAVVTGHHHRVPVGGRSTGSEFGRGALGDVPSVVGATYLDPGARLICPFPGLTQVGPGTDHTQHPPTVALEVVGVAPGGTRVQHVGTLQGVGRADTTDHVALDGIGRVALGRHHHGH